MVKHVILWQLKDELTADEKNEISHRGLAVKKLMEAFPVWKAEQ